MGRHSVPDDDADVVEVVEQSSDVLVAARPGRGRHAAPDADVAPDTAPADAADAGDAGDADDADGAIAEAEASVTAETVPLPSRRQPNADLRMLREDATLRTRCAAAVIVPFVLYTAVLLVIGRTDVYLIWFWIPTVSAGVLAGLFLDIAARRKQRADDDG